MRIVEVSSSIRGTEIPIPAIRVHDSSFVIDFFREVFESCRLEQATDKHGCVVPYQHELVIPGDATKPLVVVRGGYDSVNPPTTEDSTGRDDWTTIGRRYFKVLTEPEQTGSFNQKLAVTVPRVTGHGSWFPTEEVDYPERPFDEWGSQRWEKFQDWKFSILKEVVELIS